MNPCVVDASVVAGTLFPEEHTDKARRLLLSGRTLRAPDLLRIEVAAVIWKRHLRGQIDPDDAAELLEDMLRLPLEFVSSAELICQALALALTTGRTVYDCLYLALAARDKTVAFTADQRLVNALKGGAMGKHVAWIGSYS